MEVLGAGAVQTKGKGKERETASMIRGQILQDSTDLDETIGLYPEEMDKRTRFSLCSHGLALTAVEDHGRPVRRLVQ